LSHKGNKYIYAKIPETKPGELNSINISFSTLPYLGVSCAFCYFWRDKSSSKTRLHRSKL